jgi:hypothetical protein
MRRYRVRICIATAKLCCRNEETLRIACQALHNTREYNMRTGSVHFPDSNRAECRFERATPVSF